MLMQLRTDFAQAARTLFRQRGLTLTALFSLTLGIGITSGTFTLLNALVLRPIPGIERPERVLTLGLSLREENGYSPPWWLSYPDFQAIEGANRVFSGMAAAALADAAVQLPAGTQLVRGELVTAEYFRVLGTRPERGRFLGRADAQADAVVISHAFWTGELDAAPDVIGRTLLLNGHPFTVVGIAPAAFHGMTPADVLGRVEQRVAFWLPLAAADRVRPAGLGGDPLHSVQQRWLRVIGRVRDGLDVDAARAATGPLAATLASEFPGARSGARIEPGDLVFGPGTSGARGAIMIAAFLVVPLLVLLIACVNVAGLLLASGVTRQRELAVRLSLGASRGRVLALLLRESLLLALAAGALALGFAAWTRRIAAAFSIRPAGDVPLDTRVLLFTLAVALLTGAVFGVLPALRATRVPPALLLRGGASTPSGGTARLRRALVAAQLALCCVMLVTCMLFVRSAGRGMQVDTGYAEAELLLVNVNLEVLGLAPEEGRAVYDRLLEAARAVPGVRAVGSASGLPLTGARDVRVEAGGMPAVATTARADDVADDYFAAAGLALLAGHGFERSDRGVAPARAVVNRALAQRLWPGESPLGRTLELGEPGSRLSLSVIGVAENVRVTLEQPAEPLVYLPLESRYSPYRTLLVRTGGEHARVIPALRRALAQADPRLPLVSVLTMRDLRREALLPIRLVSSGLGLLGALALLLAAVGLFGLISYDVSRRTREIGVRVALGASRADIHRWVLRGSLATTAAGMGIGMPLAALIAVALRRGLFGLAPLDPPSFALIATLLLGVAALGTLVPARRAARVQPASAMRAE